MMKNSMSSNDDLKYGKIYTAFVYFDQKLSKGGGKKRPVILFLNQENEDLTAFQVSSQIDTHFNRKYGFEIVDWKEAGFKKPSVANLHPKDLLELKKDNLKTVVGELSEIDKVGLLEKYIHIQKQVQREMVAKRKGLER